MPREIPEFKPSQERVVPRSETEALSQSSDTKEEEVVQAKPVLNIKPENAHAIALGLIHNEVFINRIKPIVGEKLARHENITKWDKLKAETSDNIDLTREHLLDIENGNFMCFDLVADGDSVALSFIKKSGDRGLRNMDDEVLAEMLNRVLAVHRELVPQDLAEENFSMK